MVLDLGTIILTFCSIRVKQSRTLNSSDSLARTKNGSENGTEKKVQSVNFFIREY
jgi:hypothetical protein